MYQVVMSKITPLRHAMTLKTITKVLLKKQISNNNYIKCCKNKPFL